MYQYSEYALLNKEEILKRISQEEIYEIVTDYLPIANKYVISPLRTNDKHTGAYYEWVKGILLFKDFADPERRIRDCFQFIQEEFNLDYNGALQYVNNYFQLGLNGGELKPVIYELTNYSSKFHKIGDGLMLSKRKESEKNEIFRKTRKFNESDKRFWLDRYGITKDNLIEDNVFPLIWYKFYSKRKNEWLLMRPNDITYSYEEFGNGFVKIYRPFTKGAGKWITNCTENQIGFVDKIPKKGSKIFITKAYKCCRVLHNQKLNSVWFQSETMFPIDTILLEMFSDYDEIIVWYDNDESGINGALKLVTKLKELFPNKIIRSITYPKYDMWIKDPSDLRYKKGEAGLVNFINKI